MSAATPIVRKDYSRLLAKATSLIGKFGREVTLTRPEKTNAGKPWITIQTGATAAQSVTVQGIPITDERVAGRIFGESRGDQERRGFWFVTASLEIPEDLGQDWSLEDGTTKLRIRRAKPVRPGSTLLVTALEVDG